MDRDRQTLCLRTLWPAAEPPAGFAESTVERMLADSQLLCTQPPPIEPPRIRVSRSFARRVAPALALAAVIALMIAGWVLHAREHGEVFAAEPREITIGGRATALLSSGAHLAWSGSAVQQDHGAVEYRVQPGGPFIVQTPYGSVQVVGTKFEVRVGPTQAEGPSMKTEKWKIAATGATLSALLFVSVHEGKVRLANGGQQISLAQGEAGTIGADGVPKRIEPLPASPSELGASPMPRSTLAPRRPSPEQQQLRQRVVESLKERKARQAAAPAAGATVPATAAVPESRDGTMADKTGKMGDVVKVINHELMPMIDQCQRDALERNPRLHGMLALGVKLASAEGVGSIIEAVEPDATNQVPDDDFIDCIRQSAFSIDLPPPKADRNNGFLMTIPIGGDGGTR